MKLVVGLGNPGPRYRASRHNVGFRVVEHLARAQRIDLVEERFLGLAGEGQLPARADVAAERLVLLEPLTFMNRSGSAVAAALAELPEVDPARDLLVIYDDLDLPLGRIRVRPRGGAGGHNGLGDIVECLGTKDFPRLRFGIGRPEGSDAVIDFVLEGFGPEEESILEPRIEVAAQAAMVCLSEGPTAAMDRFNAAAGETAESTREKPADLPQK